MIAELDSLALHSSARRVPMRLPIIPGIVVMIGLLTIAAPPNPRERGRIGRPNYQDIVGIVGA